MNIIEHHKAEMASLSLEHYSLVTEKKRIDARLAEIEPRMRELAVIVKTAEHCESENQQALKEQREKLDGEKQHALKEQREELERKAQKCGVEPQEGEPGL